MFVTRGGTMEFSRSEYSLSANSRPQIRRAPTRQRELNLQLMVPGRRKCRCRNGPFEIAPSCVFRPRLERVKNHAGDSQGAAGSCRARSVFHDVRDGRHRCLQQRNSRVIDDVGLHGQIG